MTDFKAMKLGLKPERPSPRNFQLKSFLKATELPPIPKAVDWAQWVLEPGMMRNDEIGLCVVAGKAHQIQTWTASRGRLWRPTDEQIVQTYVDLSALDGTPYDPVTGANDDGLVIEIAFKYWRQNGLWRHPLGAYAKVDHTDLDEVRTAIALFGGVTVGAGLPTSSQNDDYWQVEDLGLKGDSAPYSWGGHDMYCSAYSPTGFTFISWGAMQHCSVRWWQSYVTECWVALSDDWVSREQPAPNGFDLGALDKALSSL